MNKESKEHRETEHPETKHSEREDQKGEDAERDSFGRGKERRAVSVAKRFRWEAAHRLSWHSGCCSHVHGHSYRMMVRLEGVPQTTTEGGESMLIDFKNVKSIVSPLIEKMDHATIVARDDKQLRAALEMIGSRAYVIEEDPTAENIAQHAAAYILDNGSETLQKNGVENVEITLWETETCYARVTAEVQGEPETGGGEHIPSTQQLMTKAKERIDAFRKDKAND